MTISPRTPDSRPAGVPANAPVKRRRHLIDPNNPQPRQVRGPMTLTTVQQWIASTLAVTTVIHLAIGLVFAAHASDNQTSRVGLIVMAGIFGVMAFAAGLAIHRKSMLHPLLLCGLLPAIIGAWWVLF